jgi:hypothetical protein
MGCGVLDKEIGITPTMALANTRLEDTYPPVPMDSLKVQFRGTRYGKRYIQIREHEVTVEEKRASGRIVVESHRKWFGDQRLGTFRVALDGVPAGSLPPEGAVDLACDPGTHIVRIRQWWYRSQPTQVHVSAGETVVLDADIPRDGSPVVRFVVFMFTPWRALSLTETANGSR